MQFVFHREQRRANRSVTLILLLALLLTLLPAVASAAPMSNTMQSGGFYYTVQAGDTLYGIANYYGVSAQAIMNVNGISNANFVWVGQRLLIPSYQQSAPPPPAGGCAAYHTVQYGQSLAWIASYYGVNMYTLARVNRIDNPNYIYAGRSLCIPGYGVPQEPPHQRPPHRPHQPPPAEPVDPCNYIVKRGDWLSTIAQRFGTTVHELMRLNNIYNPRRLEVGQRLILPACGNPQPTPVPPVPPVTVGYWSAYYYNNNNLSGAPALVSQSPAINFDWGVGGPGNGINVDNFSALFTRSDYFWAGNYRFYATADDGIRIYVDNRLIIDAWRVQPATNYYADINLNEGYHLIRVEYYEAGGVAKTVVSWGRI